MALYDAHEMRILDGLAPSIIPSRYGERRRVSWPALAAILGLHVLLVMVLDLVGALPVRRAPAELKVIQLSPQMAPPAAVETQLPTQVVKPQPVAQAQRQPPQLDAPLPIVAPPVPTLVQVEPAPPPPPPVPIESGPVRVADLDAKAVTVIAPKYPLESRRKREQGTVVLAVTLASNGSVDDVRVARSSGFDRLDRAALDAVRRWRWSPTLRDGAAVAVKGIVDIPFILQG